MPLLAARSDVVKCWHSWIGSRKARMNDALDIPEIVRQLLSNLEAHDYGTVEESLLEASLAWSESSLSQLLPILRRLPPERLAASPRLLTLQGKAQMAAGEQEAAAISLEQARLRALAGAEWAEALNATIQLVRLHHMREDLGLARVYTQLADELLHKTRLDDRGLKADTLLRVAALAPDSGLYAQGEAMAFRALSLYEASGNLAGACDALLTLFSFHNQTGRYQASASYLQRAIQLQRVVSLGPAQQVAILNKDAHWHWYQGLLAQGMVLAQRAVIVADQTDQRKQRVYNRLVAGNLARALGDYGAAQRWYDETEQLTRQLDFTLFLCWIDVHRAWLAILQGQYTGARRLLQQVLQTQDHGQAMSFSVFLAVLHHLTGRLDDAVQLLMQALAFFEQSADPLSVCTIRWHLAANYIDLGQLPQASAALADALAWMAQRRIEYLPHWWHPQIMALLCAYALAQGIFPTLAEQILVRHLRDEGRTAVQPLLQHTDSVVRRRALDVLNQNAVDPFGSLGSTLDPIVRDVLEREVAAGFLLMQKLPELAMLLRTAEERNATNPTLIAVFSLYVRGVTRPVIAESLGLSEASVRNYISHLYKLFQLSYDPAQRAMRRQQLHALACQAGFVAHLPST